MSVAGTGNCSGILSGGQSSLSGGQSRRKESSGTMQLLDRLGHGLVPLVYSSGVGEGPETRRVGGREQQEGPSPGTGGGKGGASRAGVWCLEPPYVEAYKQRNTYYGGSY